jgi:hypothetical protein
VQDCSAVAHCGFFRGAASNASSVRSSNEIAAGVDSVIRVVGLTNRLRAGAG